MVYRGLRVVLQIKNRHLRQRAGGGHFRADAGKLDVVAMSRCSVAAPAFKLCAPPLEAMVAVAQLAFFHAGKVDVEFAIGRGHDQP